MEERIGFLTPEQEKKLDQLIELKGISEALDGPAIKIADNVGLQKLKEKLLASQPDILPIIFQIIDEIFAPLP
jgi:hypothetical protein